MFKYKWTRALDLKVDLDVEMQTQSWSEERTGAFGGLRSEEGMKYGSDKKREL